MAQRTLHFYMPPWLFDRVQDPQSIFGRVAQAAAQAGWELRLHGEDDPRPRGGFHLVYNRPVEHPKTLVLRKCGFEPFFRIEATNDRWDWAVAQAPFATDKGGEWFRKYWQGALFKGHTIGSGDYVFIPLQGKLGQQRHFQTASPLGMIEQALKLDPNLPMIATLHPKQTYSREERAALQEIARASAGRFQIAQQGSMGLLAGCRYVVTQNSTLALIGMFAGKMPVLFAQIDFHHQAASVPHLGLAGAYQQLGQPRRWGAYLHWYFKENAISARDDAAPQAILARLAQLGWPVHEKSRPE